MLAERRKCQLLAARRKFEHLLKVTDPVQTRKRLEYSARIAGIDKRLTELGL